MEKRNLILDLAFQFSLDIIAYTEALEERRRYGMAKQLFRSGTSIGANVNEAQFAESTTDFIHKLKIAEKEAKETEYWLLLCRKAPRYPDPGELDAEIKSIQRILAKIISTSRQKYNYRNR